MEISFNEWVGVNRLVTVSRWCDTEPSHGQVMSNVLVTHPGHHPGAEMELRHDANMSVKSVTSYWVTRAHGWLESPGVSDHCSFSAIMLNSQVSSNLMGFTNHYHKASTVWWYHNSIRGSHYTLITVTAGKECLPLDQHWPMSVSVLSGVKHPVLRAVISRERLEMITRGN